MTPDHPAGHARFRRATAGVGRHGRTPGRGPSHFRAPPFDVIVGQPDGPHGPRNHPDVGDGMTWVLVIAGAWLLVAVAAALVLGRVVREADRRENSTQSGPGTAVPGSSTAPA